MNKNEFTDNIINIYKLLKTLKDAGLINDFKLNNSYENNSVSIDIAPKKIFPEEIDISVNITTKDETQ